MAEPGIILKGNFSFQEVLTPLTQESSGAYWIVDVQQGPFNSEWLSSSKVNEVKVNRKRLDIPTLADTSVTCWRPYTFPALANHVIVDECSYFAACFCSEAEIQERSARIWELLGANKQEEWDRLLSLSDIVFFQVDGWWEIYTRHNSWRRQFRDRFEHAYERSWRHAFEAP